MPRAAAGPLAPAAGDRPPAGPVALAPASLARRLASVAYEGLLLGAVLLGTGFLLAPWVSPGTGASALGPVPLPATTPRLVLFAALFGVAAVYFCWSWSDGRRTLPMKTWRMRLTLRDGARVDRGSAIVRFAAAWIGPALALAAYAALKPTGAARYALWLAGLNYAWAWIDPERAFLHDRIAGTRIVREPR
jgi:uncharacterized RDD family membrane protein YckC